jgi:hypothetical protein
MSATMKTHLETFCALALVMAASGQAFAQSAATVTTAPAESTAPAASTGRIKKLTGVWVEGPGFDIKYGAAYDMCASRCLANPACVMIEYYRPEKKCNLYREVRPRLKGGSSFVGLRQ